MRFVLFLILAVGAAAAVTGAYQPFGKTAYLTSSFGENRGTRYHAGIDFSTEMEEGWAVLAPSDGAVEFAARGAFGYGRHIKFRAADKHIWVFAHLSNFSPKIDSLIRREMLKKEKAAVSLSMKIPFKKGDTLAFSGSSGIGNPHLHVERRTPDGKIALNPCEKMECPDTVKPFIFGADTAFGGLAVKIADYSRTPFENPMSIKTLKIAQKGKPSEKIIYAKKYDSLPFDSKKMIRIRNDLLWAEEADTAGDWHFIPKLKDVSLLNKAKGKTGSKAGGGVKIGGKAIDGGKINGNAEGGENAGDAAIFKKGFKIIVEDFNGNVSETDLENIENASGQPHLNQPKKIPPLKFQDSSLYTFLARTQSEEKPPFANSQTKRLTKRDEIFSSSVSVPKNSAIKNAVEQKFKGIDEMFLPSLAAWKSAECDSQPATANACFEFHPKGLQLEEWELCLDTAIAPHPLYYLGETSRKWFYFSKQTLKNGKRCVKINELRDIGSFLDTVPPKISQTPTRSIYIKNAECRLPVADSLSGLDFASVEFRDKNGKWIIFDYDSEPSELVVERRDFDFSEPLNLKMCDEAGNCSKTTINNCRTVVSVD